MYSDIYIQTSSDQKLVKSSQEMYSDINIQTSQDQILVKSRDELRYKYLDSRSTLLHTVVKPRFKSGVSVLYAPDQHNGYTIYIQ